MQLRVCLLMCARFALPCIALISAHVLNACAPVPLVRPYLQGIRPSWTPPPISAGASLVLPSSLGLLALAQALRARGALPASTQLWVVANPNTERDASLLERKVDAGAQVSCAG
jgi:hypothetical protein